jgi:hypothetical protein
MVDQNIGRPLRKILSYRCSTTLVFKVWWGFISIFGDLRGRTLLNEIKPATSRRHPAPKRRPRADPRPRALPRGAPALLDVRALAEPRPEAAHGPSTLGARTRHVSLLARAPACMPARVRSPLALPFASQRRRKASIKEHRSALSRAPAVFP